MSLCVCGCVQDRHFKTPRESTLWLEFFDRYLTLHPGAPNVAAGYADTCLDAWRCRRKKPAFSPYSDKGTKR